VGGWIGGSGIKKMCGGGRPFFFGGPTAPAAPCLALAVDSAVALGPWSSEHRATRGVRPINRHNGL
jgi:hypothetical protein